MIINSRALIIITTNDVYLNMNYFTKIISIFILTHILSAQIIQEQMLFDEDGNQVDIFAYQIPENYNPNNSHPLLVAFHQWGGNQLSPFNTLFDEESNERNWILLNI